MTELFFIRHGETDWTRERRYQGWTDKDLSDAGRVQARLTAGKLKRSGIEFIYTSTLSRARETGEIIARQIRKRILPDARIREIGFGNWEGKTAAEIIRAKDRGFLNWTQNKPADPTNGEPIEVFRRRVRRFLKEILRKHKNRKIAVISHGGPIKVMICEALGLPQLPFWALRVDPASVSLVIKDIHFVQLVYLNNTSHLTGSKNKRRKT